MVFGVRAAPESGDLETLCNALDWVAPGFEIVQSHCPDWRFTAAQTVMDGGLHGRQMVGPRQPVAALGGNAGQLQEVLAGLRVTLSCNEKEVDAGVGFNVLGNPLLALRHLVEGLNADTQAAPLDAGDIVTTGTLTDAWPVVSGQTWVAHFHGIWPDLSIRFSG